MVLFACINAEKWAWYWGYFITSTASTLLLVESRKASYLSLFGVNFMNSSQYQSQIIFKKNVQLQLIFVVLKLSHIFQLMFSTLESPLKYNCMTCAN